MTPSPAEWQAVVPQHMQERPQWVAWGPDPDSGKPKCPLILGATERRASSTDSSTWRPFAAAAAHYTRHASTASGVGYVFTPADGLVFVDLDHCLDDVGELKPWALPFAAPFLGRTYVERSPSGHGLHVFVRGSGPVTGKKLEVGDGAIEVYTRARYSTVTGNTFAGSDLLDEAAEALAALLGHVEPPPPPRRPRPVVVRLDEHRDYRVAGDALRWLDPDMVYADWLTAGQALHSRWPGDGGPGFVLWDAWSARGEKYPGSEALARKWRSFQAGGGITLGSLVYLAERYGARRRHA